LSKQKLIYGNIVSPVDDQNVNYFPKAAMVLKQKSRGSYVVEDIIPESQAHILAKQNRNWEVHDFSGSLILPTIL